MSRGAPWWMGLASWLGALAFRLLGLTWRIRGGRVDERCIYALWHSQLLALTYTHRERGVGVIISQHRDGELIARIVERMGYVPARGSSTRGGDEAVRDMLRLGERGHVLAITTDGPRGPARQVKPGIVYLASRTGIPVIPVVASTADAWRMRSWDRFEVPRPFARIVVGYGAPLTIPGGLADGEAEAWRLRIQRALSDLGQEMARRSGEAP